MELNAQNVQGVSHYLEQSLSHERDVRKAAEDSLRSVEAMPGYSQLLVHVMQSDAIPGHIRQAASVTFKNYIKANWHAVDAEHNRICDADRIAVRASIIDIMLAVPEQVQKQIGEALSIMGKSDFPDRWPTLVTDLVSRLGAGNFKAINGVLTVAHSIFKRYRHETGTERMFTEVQYVVDAFAEPLTKLFLGTVHALESGAAGTSKADARLACASLVLISKIFYSLNCQDNPQFFVDNLESWMSAFHKLIVLNSPLLASKDDDEPGPLEELKSQICENVALYAQKYDEDFNAYLPRFVDAIWHLLTTASAEPKYDLLVSTGIHFLTSVSESGLYKGLFADENTLKSICEKIIIPNISLRESDEEVFEDNPEEWMRRDLEGSDIDTRRRSACDLVRGLSKFHQERVTAIFTAYVSAMFQQYSANPSQNWRSMDAAYYLITSLAARSRTTDRGTRETNALVDIPSLYEMHAAKDMQNQITGIPGAIIAADAIKFALTFRNQVTKNVLAASIPLFIAKLADPNIVVHSYAAHAIERALVIRQPGASELLFSTDEVRVYLEPLLGNLFKALGYQGSAENEYLMRAVLRSCSSSGAHFASVFRPVLAQLSQTLVAVSKNPSKPQFNHYLFETLSCMARNVCKADPTAVEAFEAALFPPFELILQMDVAEFTPYVFQILSQLLESRPAPIPASYRAMLPLLVTPLLWERLGNVPPLVRLVQAFLAKGVAESGGNDWLLGILGVFQKLIASKQNDHEGFYLMESIIQHVPIAVVTPFLKQVFILLFQRLQSSRTPKYVRGLLVFMSLLAGTHGPAILVETVDGIQPRLFAMVAQSLYINEVQKVSGSTERKICAVGMTKILTESPFVSQYFDLWPLFLAAIVRLFELEEDDSGATGEDGFVEIEDTPGYQAAFTQLAFASKADKDPFVAIPDAKIFLAQRLAALSQSLPGKLSPLISGLDPAVANFLQRYLLAAGIPALA
eukprot:Opistho-2@94433